MSDKPNAAAQAAKDLRLGPGPEQGDTDFDLAAYNRAYNQAYIAAADKTGVALPKLGYADPKMLYWENPRPVYPRLASGKPIPEKPFVSELQKAAIKRQAEGYHDISEPGLEPQFFPALGVIKGVKQTSRFMKDDAKAKIEKIKEMLKK